jgi:archaellum component FlaC
MNIDERLERLTERHEALTQSVEILTRDVQGLTTEVRELTTEMRSGFAQTLQFINRLAHVAEAHEQRLDDLEGK